MLVIARAWGRTSVRLLRLICGTRLVILLCSVTDPAFSAWCTSAMSPSSIPSPGSPSFIMER